MRSLVVTGPLHFGSTISGGSGDVVDVSDRMPGRAITAEAGFAPARVAAASCY
jgi:hypothetical protein